MAEENDELQEEIEVKHTYANSYQLLPATGATAGVQPQGELKIDFVYDHNYKTKSEYYDTEETDWIGMEIEGHLEREHQVGVSMSPENARHAAISILAESLADRVSKQDIYEAINTYFEKGEP